MDDFMVDCTFKNICNLKSPCFDTECMTCICASYLSNISDLQICKIGTLVSNSKTLFGQKLNILQDQHNNLYVQHISNGYGSGLYKVDANWINKQSLIIHISATPYDPTNGYSDFKPDFALQQGV